MRVLHANTLNHSHTHKPIHLRMSKFQLYLFTDRGPFFIRELFLQILLLELISYATAIVWVSPQFCGILRSYQTSWFLLPRTNEPGNLGPIYIQRLWHVAATSLPNLIFCFGVVLLHWAFSTATVTNFAVAGELLCDWFGSDIVVMSQTRRCRWM